MALPAMAGNSMGATSLMSAPQPQAAPPGFGGMAHTDITTPYSTPLSTPNFGTPGSNLPPNLSLYTPGQSSYQAAINTATPSAGISPMAQSAIDAINKQVDYYSRLNASNAQGLAASRGLAGSSIEQFGTQQALAQTQQAGLSQMTPILTQGMAQNAALQQLQAQIQAGQGQQLNTLGSDEVASLRNMALSQQQLQLQQSLGQQGINLGQQNISAAQQMAQQQAQNQLLMGGTQLLAPYLLGGGGVGGGAFGGGLLGGGGGGFGGGTGFLGLGGGVAGGIQTGVPYAGAGAPASSLFPGGIGPVGTGSTAAGTGGLIGAGGTLLNTAGTSSMGAGNIAPGVGGMLIGQKLFGNNADTNAGAIIGGVGGSIFGPAGTMAGSVLGAGAGALGSKVDTEISKKFGNTAGSIARYANPITALGGATQKVEKALGGSKESMQGSSAWQQNMSADQQAVMLGNPGMTPNYDSNKKGSFEQNYNSLLSGFNQNQLQARYANVAATGNTSILQTNLDKQNYEKYQNGSLGSPF